MAGPAACRAARKGDWCQNTIAEIDEISSLRCFGCLVTGDASAFELDGRHGKAGLSELAAETNPLSVGSFLQVEAGANEPTQGSRAGWVLGAGALGAVGLFLLLRSFGVGTGESATAATGLVCAVFWVLQPVPIPVTSLIPFAVLPLFGVLDHKQVARSYGHTLVLLLMAGFMLSNAIESSGAHRRLALGMASLVSGRQGATAHRLLLGFMMASALMSMWISNTASVLILLPVVLATTEQADRRFLRERLLVGVAYAGSIGGLGTPIGTPPNLLFMATRADLGQETWAFSDWMQLGVPVVLLMVPLAFFVLAWGLPRQVLPPLPSVSGMTKRERRVLGVFGLTALGWVTRVEPFGGWSAWFGAEGAGDSTVAFIGLLLMLLVPSGEGGRLMSWKDAERAPWGILLLFGGGLALAAAFSESGLSERVAHVLSALAGFPELLMVLGVCLGVTFLTEMTSNTATAALLMPILGATARSVGMDPTGLMAPAALSASCAFMLPVATAPNAIIFASGEVRTGFMARRGAFLNVIGALVVTSVVVLLL